MAFATSAVSSGNSGSSFVLQGKFTAAAGDTSGTVKIPAGIVRTVQFLNLDSDLGENSHLECSLSTSGTVTTITVNTSSMPITNGRFYIVYN